MPTMDHVAEVDQKHWYMDIEIQTFVPKLVFDEMRFTIQFFQ